jgi:polysaccharide export outer membrane protein
MLMLAGTSGCASSQSGYTHYAAEHDPRRHDYIIGVADRLRINVWKDAELSTDAIVRPDGTITVPLVGDLRAAGRTTRQLKDEIRSRLTAYVKDAVVTVALTEINSYRFTVTGEVAHPGVFTAPSFITVSEAIALAGGPSRYASASDVVLIRRASDGKQRRIPIDYDAILDGDNPEQDIAILTGDTVYVP